MLIIGDTVIEREPVTESYSGPQGTQKTVSEGHPFYSRKKGSLGDVGGNFFTSRSYALEPASGQGQAVDFFENGFRKVFRHSGPILAVNPRNVLMPPSAHSSNETLDELGATAVARSKPTNSVANAATFLGELYKDKLPLVPGSQTWESRTLTARKAGEEFLNVEFGWQPLVSDISSLATAVTHAEKILSQYERDAGKVVRRRYNFPERRTIEKVPFSDDTQTAFYAPAAEPLVGGPRSAGEWTRETVHRQWFSGAFTYALPSGYDSRNKLSRYALYADKVLGLSLTPETLWNLAPWSWAADWFSNTGDVISNITSWAADGLVMQYGYMMEHSIVTDTYTRAKTGLKTGGGAQPVTLVTETKVRRKANPFGFGLTWEGLSPLQLAIAAAIGITR